MGERGPKKGSGGRPRKTKNDPRTGDGYVRVTVGPKSKGKQVYKHRAVKGLGKGSKSKGAVVDHIDGNTANNDPKNLRTTTKKGNAKNR